MKDIFSIRKTNLTKLVADKFQNNKSAFGRAAGVHHNHVNLLLSSNENYKRNLGEELARRIEQAIGLPELWLDNPTTGVQPTYTIRSVEIDQQLSRAVVNSINVKSMVITDVWVASVASLITSVDNLILASASTDEMAPQIKSGDTIVIDTGYKAASSDGVYVLTRGDAAFLRRIRRQSDGSHSLSVANPDYHSDKPESLKGMKVVGKIVFRNGNDRV